MEKTVVQNSKIRQEVCNKSQQAQQTVARKADGKDGTERDGARRGGAVRCCIHINLCSLTRLVQQNGNWVR